MRIQWRLAAWFGTLMLYAWAGCAAAADAAAGGQGDAAGEALHDLFDDERDYVWRTNPLEASSAGVHDYDDRLPRVTPAAQAERLAADRAFLARLEDIDRAALGEQDQVSYDLFGAMVSSRVLLNRHRDWRIPLTSDSGFYTSVLLMHRLTRLRDVQGYEHYLERLQEVPRYFAENIDNMRLGMREGFTLPAVILDGISSVIAQTLYSRPEAAPLWEPFERFPANVSEPDRRRLAAAGRAVLADEVLPAYRDFQRFFEEEYRPAARDTIAASALPDGRDYYHDLVRYYTTLPDATPRQVHDIGRQEVARIRAAMADVVDEVAFDGGFEAFLEFLRSDPRFYAKTPEELLKEAAWIAKQIDGRLPEYFGTLPRTPYGVKPVPAALAPNYTAGRYNGGSAGDAGEYWVNTHALDTRPLYALPALTLHEAVPGHHLQNALAREADGVPAFRREFYPHAFGEGWGLYAERLGEEMDIYQTPYQRFGRLTYDMWRACRLVVDTGMHAFGWTRQQALDYMTEHTALSNHEIRTEVDRYISWPGQALAYKIGELEIVRLRQHAAAALGGRFDLREFHDVVLGSGGVTLPVLERQVEAYVTRAAAAAEV